MQIKATIPNLDRIVTAFKTAPEQMRREFIDALDISTKKIEAEAKKRAPVNKETGGGNLRQSISSSVMGLQGKVIVGAKYAIFVHEGTRPHIIRARTKKVLANERTGSIFGKVVKHPGTRKQPFLQEALDDSNDFISKTFSQAADNVLGDIAKL